MGLLDIFTKRANRTETPRESRGGDEIAMVTAKPGDLLSGTRYQQAQRLQLVMRYSKWVKVAASRNAQAVAAVPIRVYRVAPKSGALRTARVGQAQVKRLREWCGHRATKAFGNYREGWEEVTDDRHPLVALLSDANKENNGYELIENLQLFMELSGDGYWVKSTYINGLPTELWNLFPQFMEIAPNEDGSIGVYKYGRPDKIIPYKPEAVVHFKFPNPHDPFYGLSPLASCVEEADVSKDLTTFARSFLHNGIVGGATLFAPGSTKDVREEMRRELESKYAGPERANRWRIFGGPKETRVEYAPQLDKNPILSDSENMARNIIAAAFDMPVGLLNMEERSLANGKVVAPHWQLLSIKPRCQRLEDKVNEDLLPEFRERLNDPTLIVCFDNPVDEDRQAMVLEVTTLAGGKPLITRDEARSKLGLPPLTPEQAEELEPPEPEPGAPGESKGKDDSSKAALWHGDGHDPDVAIKALPKGLLATIKALADQLTKAFNAYAGKYANLTTAPGLMVETDQAFGREMVATIADILDVPVATVYLAGFNGEVPKLNAHDAEMRQMEALTHDAVDFLDGYKIRVADSVVQTYEGRIRSILQAGLREGQTQGQIAQQIRATVPVESPASALRIARTEVSRALNAGKVLAWNESGIVTRKEWLLSGNPCKVCRAIHKDYRYADVNQPFVKRGTVVEGRVMDYADVDGGDGHPSCSCSVGAVFVPQIERAR